MITSSLLMTYWHLTDLDVYTYLCMCVLLLYNYITYSPSVFSSVECQCTLSAVWACSCCWLLSPGSVLAESPVAASRAAGHSWYLMPAPQSQPLVPLPWYAGDWGPHAGNGGTHITKVSCDFFIWYVSSELIFHINKRISHPSAGCDLKDLFVIVGDGGLLLTD